ncbi:MAG: hypothetical protein QFX38_08010 [Methanothermobacter sp.]|nr:hypothetical protein [Methanothermobacter sp.]
MEDKGFLYTLDAILAITMLLIITASLTHFLTLEHYLPSEYRNYNAVDIMDLMATYETENGTILEMISHEFNSHQNHEEAIKEANMIASEFLNSKFPNIKYNLTIYNGLESITIASNADMAKADNINSATKNYNNYTFQLYIW